MSAGASLPWPTYKSVPAMPRTMWYKNPSALTRMRRRAPSSSTRQSNTVRTVEETGVPAERRAAKSCRPIKCPAACCIRPTSSG